MSKLNPKRITKFATTIPVPLLARVREHSERTGLKMTAIFKQALELYLPKEKP